MKKKRLKYVNPKILERGEKMAKKLKVKTNRSAAKRFKITANGKILCKRSGKSHLLRKKNRKRKRRLGQYKELFKGFYSHIKECIPYKF